MTFKLNLPVICFSQLELIYNILKPIYYEKII